MPKNVVTWIHLSDCHMEATDRFNRNVVLGALWKDITQFRESGIAADFIVFTGDVAYHGLPTEYQLAASEFFDPLLHAAQVSKRRLFIVPGNHDIDRRRTGILKNPLDSVRNEDDLRRMVEDTEERELLMSPLRSYHSFIKSYFGSDLSPAFDVFGYASDVEIENRKITVLSLNSAWLSGFNRTPNGEVDDCKKLAITEFQLRRLLDDDSAIRIAAIHHPLDWFLEYDQVAVEELLAKTCPILLRGHLHRPDAFVIKSLAGESLTIPAGAVFDRRKSPNSYNIVQLNLETGRLKIFLRRYNDRRAEWQKDIESTGEGLDGRAEFTVPIPGKPLSRPLQDIHDIREYRCTFTEDCRQGLLTLKLTSDDLLALVQAEFASHVNYFLFDLEHYPMPLGTQYIVYLHKVGDTIQFDTITPATSNEIQLTKWNDILALYRRATRMDYREDPMKVVLIRGMAERACNLHTELATRMVAYYNEFEHISRPQLPKVKRVTRAVDANEVRIHLNASRTSIKEVQEIEEAIEVGDISPERAVGLLVSALEKSLQHLHKLILLYPPKSR